MLFLRGSDSDSEVIKFRTPDYNSGGKKTWTLTPILGLIV